MKEERKSEQETSQELTEGGIILKYARRNQYFVPRQYDYQETREKELEK